MALTFEIPAQNRSVMGKGASRRLRRADNLVPAIVYGGEEKAVNIAINHDFLLKALEHEAFYSHILTLKLDGKTEKVVLKNIQRHPFKPRILHLDLLRINPNNPITLRVPLHFIGDNVAPGVKTAGGLVSHLINDIEVRCLPAHLPEFIEVDLSKMELDQTLHLSDLQLPEGVELVALTHNDDLPVASIHLARGGSADETVAENASTAS
ncbi:MAG: 50S ribosomal protein L25 [Legionellaceae bacterium]